MSDVRTTCPACGGPVNDVTTHEQAQPLSTRALRGAEKYVIQDVVGTCKSTLRATTKGLSLLNKNQTEYLDDDLKHVERDIMLRLIRLCRLMDERLVAINDIWELPKDNPYRRNVMIRLDSLRRAKKASKEEKKKGRSLADIKARLAQE